MSIAIEAKLTSRERSNLVDSDFGLPDDRKFPLNDEAHVVKAVQFFKYCKRTKRNELAKNINKRIRELKLDISVSKRNPFYKYADKNIVTITENAYDNEFVEESISDNLDFIKKYPLYSCDDIIALEKWCMVVIDEAFEKCLIANTSGIFIEAVNKHLYEEYNEFAEFLGQDPTMYNLVEGAKNELIESLSDVNTLNKKFSTLVNIFESSYNKHHVYRACSEILSAPRYEYGDDLESILVERYMADIESIKDDASRNLRIPKNNIPNILSEQCDIFNIPPSWCLTETAKVELDKEYYKSKNDLYIINSSLDRFFSNNGITLKPCCDKYKDLQVVPNRIRMIGSDIDLQKFDGADTLFLNKKHIEYSNSTYWGSDVDGKKILFCHSDSLNKDYLVGKVRYSENHELVLIELTPETIDFITGLTDVSDAPKVRVIRISEPMCRLQKNIDLNKIVSEAFAVNEDGDIKITISPKNSYMDSYSSNHKMLVENWKNKNYEAMKKNLAYVFALILTIERSDEYKSKDPKAIKARAFAINDFKTYLKHLQSVEPDFDFVEYYGASDYDKKIINIPRTTISGIKKLVRTILL